MADELDAQSIRDEQEELCPPERSKPGGMGWLKGTREGTAP